MADGYDKTVNQFEEVTEPDDADILYLIRGLAEDRDKFITLVNLLKILTDKDLSLGVLTANEVITDKITQPNEYVGVGVQAVSGEYLRTLIIPIGSWNMDTSAGISVPHSIPDPSKIKNVFVFIRKDDGSAVYPLSGSTGTLAGYIAEIGLADVTLGRVTSGFFDSADFSSTETTRGWVYLVYED